MTLRRLWPASALFLLAPALVGLSADKDQYGDPLPEGATARLGTNRLRGFTYTSPQLAADGKTLLVTGPGGLLRVDPGTGERLGKVPGPTAGYFAGLSADGKRAVHVGYDGVTVWDAATGATAVKMNRRTPSGDGAAALSADGKFLAAGGSGDRTKKQPVTVLVWDVAGNRKVNEITVPHNESAFVALSADGKTLANWGYHYDPNARPEDQEISPGRFVYFWDVASGKELSKFRSPGSFTAPAVAFAPGGLAAVGTGSGVIDLVDPKTGASKMQLLGRSRMGRFLTFSPDGSVLGAAGDDGSVQRWKVGDGARLSTTDPPVAGMYNVRVRLLDGERGVAWGQKGLAAVVWEVPSGKAVSTVGGHMSAVSGVGITPDGKHVLTSADPGPLLKWELATGKAAGEFALRQPGAGAFGSGRVVFSADGTRALMRDSNAGVGVYDLATGGQSFAIPSLGSFSERESLSADGSKVVITADPAETGFGPSAKKLPARVGVWDAASGKKVGGFDLPGYMSVSAAVSPDGKHLITAGLRGTPNKADRPDDFAVTGWDLATGAKKGEFVDRPTFGTAFVAAAPDNKTVLVAVGDGRLVAVDFLTGTKGRVLDTKGRGAAATPVFSPDGKRVAVACGSGFGENATSPIHVFDWATGEIRSTFAQPGQPPLAMAFSPDGKRLVTGAGDTTALVWDVSK